MRVSVHSLSFTVCWLDHAESMNRVILFFVVLFLLGAARAGQEASFSFRIEGCAGTENGTPPPPRSPPPTVDPKIEIAGSGLRYFRAGMHQCCRKVEVREQMQKGRIILTEFWTGEGCRCMCASQIEATLTNLATGEYEVTVYSGGIEPVTHKGIEPKEILSQKVQIP